MSIPVGMDALAFDPLDEVVMSILADVQTLAGQDDFYMNYSSGLGVDG